MATYKKGLTPEEKKIIDTTKSTFKSVFESMKTSLFPNTLSGYSFEDLKESFIYKYVRNFVGGLLIIGFVFLFFYLCAMFVTWGLPKTDNEPMSDDAKVFARMAILGYNLIILLVTAHDD
jgi:hypothetical protein